MGTTADSVAVLKTPVDSLDAAASSSKAAAERAGCLQECCVKTPLCPWKVDRRGKSVMRKDAYDHSQSELLAVRTEPGATASLDSSCKLKGCSRTWDDIGSIKPATDARSLIFSQVCTLASSFSNPSFPALSPRRFTERS